jgi:hypothetical protein
VCTQALARRVQLQILRDELGAIARAIRLDEKARATISPSAATFAADVEKAEPLSEKDVVPLFKACDVGTVKLRAEQGSDLLAQTVSQTLAVSTSAVSGKHAGLPARLQRFLRSLRGFALVFHLLVSQALAGTRAAGTIAAAMLAAGAALVGVGLLVRIPGILLVVGVALALGGILLAAYRHRWQIPWKAIVVAAVLAMGVRIAIWIWDAIDDGQGRPGWVAFLERIEPVTVVLGLVVGATTRSAPRDVGQTPYPPTERCDWAARSDRPLRLAFAGSSERRPRSRVDRSIRTTSGRAVAAARRSCFARAAPPAHASATGVPACRSRVDTGHQPSCHR